MALTALCLAPLLYGCALLAAAPAAAPVAPPPDEYKIAGVPLTCSLAAGVLRSIHEEFTVLRQRVTDLPPNDPELFVLITEVLTLKRLATELVGYQAAAGCSQPKAV